MAKTTDPTAITIQERPPRPGSSDPQVVYTTGDPKGPIDRALNDLRSPGVVQDTRENRLALGDSFQGLRNQEAFWRRIQGLKEKATDWCLRKACEDLRSRSAHELMSYGLNPRVLKNLPADRVLELLSLATELADHGRDDEIRWFGSHMKGALQVFALSHPSLRRPADFNWGWRMEPIDTVQPPPLREHTDRWEDIYASAESGAVSYRSATSTDREEKDRSEIECQVSKKRLIKKKVGKKTRKVWETVMVKCTTDRQRFNWWNEMRNKARPNSEDPFAWTRGQRVQMEEAAERMAPLAPYLEQPFVARDFGRDGAYVTLVETHFTGGRVSSAGAAGYYQFLEGPAKEAGLLVEPDLGIDERENPILASRAAAYSFDRYGKALPREPVIRDIQWNEADKNYLRNEIIALLHIQGYGNLRTSLRDIIKQLIDERKAAGEEGRPITGTEAIDTLLERGSRKGRFGPTSRDYLAKLSAAVGVFNHVITNGPAPTVPKLSIVTIESRSDVSLKDLVQAIEDPYFREYNPQFDWEAFDRDGDLRFTIPIRVVVLASDAPWLEQEFEHRVLINDLTLDIEDLNPGISS